MDQFAEVPSTVGRLGLNESLIKLYRHAERLNQDPLSKVTRTKQSLLMIFSLTTILLTLSVVEIDSLSAGGLKVRVPPASVDFIRVVLSLCSGYYLVAFALSAGQDRANERYRTLIAYRDFDIHITSQGTPDDVVREADAAMEESDRLRNLALFQEPAIQNKMNSDFFKDLQIYEEPVKTAEEKIISILSAALERQDSTFIPFFPTYEQVIDKDVKLTDEEEQALLSAKKDREVALAAKQIFEASYHARMDDSHKKGEALFAESMSSFDAWVAKTEHRTQQIAHANRILEDLGKYRNATKWVEVVFPCLLGFLALSLVIVHFWHPMWISHLQMTPLQTNPVKAW